MKQFAVIGHPIGHSLSPLMHNTAFKLLGLHHQYEALDIEPSALRQTIERFREQGFGGFNITAPHKVTVIPYLDQISPEAEAIGSVNTVVNTNGILLGTNTDTLGIQQSLEHFRSEIENSKCLIMGAGGAARSVAYVITRYFRNVHITIAARSLERAQNIGDEISSKTNTIQIIDISGNKFNKAVSESRLIINATTLGMFPRVLDSPIPDQQWISNKQIVFDLVYRPLRTRLLKDSIAAGARTIGGLEMFVYQGAAAFRLWTGMEMPLEQIKQALENKLSGD
jgi:shikimate dehydrogenase